MDTLTAGLMLRNQNTAIVEAEEVIQSWLEGVENSRPRLDREQESGSHDYDLAPHDIGDQSRHPDWLQSHSHIPRTAHIFSTAKSFLSPTEVHVKSATDSNILWSSNGGRDRETELRTGGMIDNPHQRRVLFRESDRASHTNAHPSPYKAAPSITTTGQYPWTRPSSHHQHQFTDSEGEPDMPTARSLTDPPDVLSTLDWTEGDVRENARAVVSGLLKKSLVSETKEGRKGRGGGGGGGGGSRDPRVTMEMRHKQVKERRRERDLQQSQSLQSKLTAREARQEAELMVRKEERERKRRRMREEAIVKEQMVAIRRKMNEERERRRLLEDHLSSMVGSHPPTQPPSLPPTLTLSPQLDLSDGEAVMQCAEECVREGKRERRRVETRAELARQLQEAEATEAKRNLKLLHQCFSAWYLQVTSERGKLARVATVANWKLQLRAWKAWRAYVGGRKARRERDMLAREMQREKRQVELASSHHCYRLLLRCFSSWEIFVRSRKAIREQERTASEQRAKMAAFLQAATSSDRRGVSEELRGGEGGSGGREVEERKTPGSSAVVGKRAGKPVSNSGSAGRGGKMRESQGASVEPIIWQTVRKQLDMLLSEAAMRATEEHKRKALADTKTRRDKPQSERTPTQQRGEELQDKKEESEKSKNNGSPPVIPSSDQRVNCTPQSADHPLPRLHTVHNAAHHSSSNSPKHSSLADAPNRKIRSRPPTKPVPLSGMAARSAEIAHRREAREERKRQQEAERLAKLEKEAEEKREAERQAKEILAAKKKEERRLAKQRALEQQERQHYIAELTKRAREHYETTLLRERGLKPWRRFVGDMRDCRRKAEDRHQLNLVKSAMCTWKTKTEARVREREERAEVMHRKFLLRGTMQSWMKYVDHCRRLEQLANDVQWNLLLRCTFRTWRRGTREERVKTWEKERRAKMHYQRYLKHRMLVVWLRFVPLSKEEKVKERRRADLRRKVVAWLPDYEPRSQHH